MSTITRTVWYCWRCKRPLVNDKGHKAGGPEDTVTASRSTGRVVHDQCAGDVAPSQRSLHKQ